MIYAITKSFPRDELYAMASQMRRAAVSVASNIAEGKGRASDSELLHFLATSRGSLFELRTQVVIAKGLGYVNSERYQELFSLIEEVGRLINGLMTSVRNRINGSQKSSRASNA